VGIEKVEYGQELVVAVRHAEVWAYYLSEKDFWMLDQMAWAQGFRDAGYQMPEDYSDRFGLPVVDQNNAREFLTHMAEFRVSAELLREALLKQLTPPADMEEAVLFLPALLVDFDSRKLRSCFPEPFPFEKYIPDGWSIASDPIWEQIPPEFRYWVIEGRDYSSLASGGVPG